MTIDIINQAPAVQLFGPLKAAYEAYAASSLLHDPENPPSPDVLSQRALSRTVTPLALDDWLARIYLARLSAKLVFSGTVTGALRAFLWKLLLLLAFSPAEKAQVRLEVRFAAWNPNKRWPTATRLWGWLQVSPLQVS